MVLEAEALDGLVAGAAGLAAADHHEVDVVALGAELGDRLEQELQALHGDVGRRGGDEAAGDGLHLGQRLEQLDVDADGHDGHALGVDLVVGDDVLEGVLRHRDDPLQPAGDLGLHVDEAVPAAQRELLVPALGGLDLEAAVDGDRVVDRAEHRDAELALDEEQAVAEALVVLDDVELALAVAEVVPGPHREGERLGEGAADEGGDLEDVLPVLQLPDPGLPHREVVVVDVEAGELDQRDPLVEDRVRLAAQHLDVVAEVDQRLGEVAGVDALAADVGLPPVGEVGDPEGCVVGHGPTSLSGC